MIDKRDKKRVYIIHPFKSDPVANIERVTEICRRIKNEVVPLAPQLLLHGYILEDTERKLALEHGLVLLKGCDEAWICSSRISPGMAEEIVYAKLHGIEVFNVTRIFEDIK